MNRSHLGEFEHIVLLAVLRLGSGAYAPAIMDEIEQRTGRAPSQGAMYVTLDRLEEKRLLRSRIADANDERGGRPRRYVAVTALGLKQLRASRATLVSLWHGLEVILET
jgi:PadR family transcriptional regulator PadR